MSRYGFGCLLVGQLDVAADRERPGFLRAAVRCLHQPRTAAGDDRETRVAERRPERAGELVVRVPGRSARRAEHRHRALDAGERAEAGRELFGDVAHAVGVGRSHLRRLAIEPEQQLLVERGPAHAAVARAPASLRRARRPSRERRWSIPRRAIRGATPRGVVRCPSMSAPHPLEDEIPYTVRRSARARRVRVNVHAHAGVEVVLPARAAEREAAAAVVELRPWIERRLAEAREAMAAVAGRGRHAALPRRDARARARARPHTRASARRGAVRPRRRRRARRSSAGTGAAARAEIAPRLDRASAAAGLRLQRARHPRAAHALGVVLLAGADELQLAAAAGARAGARIRRLARGLPPRGARPLAALLGAARQPPAELARGARVAVARTGRRWCCRPVGAASPRRAGSAPG